MGKVVIALGGNALGYSNLEQVSSVKKVAKIIVDLKEEGYDIVVTHGNGPQVGKINKAMDSIDDDIPFAECGAMSEGYIGYHLVQAIRNELDKRNIEGDCTSVITQVVVNKNDKAFLNPTKPIGKYYTKDEAKKLEKETGFIYKEEINKGFRRVIASPKPVEIVELDSVKKLLNEGNIVIACGGGGVPVIRKRNKLEGIDAVIDKDLSSSLLARELKVDKFLILTNVEKACINYGTSDEKQLDYIYLDELNKYKEGKQFAPGSMLPKVEACALFAEYSSKPAVITSLDKAKDGVLGKTGTVICKRDSLESEKFPVFEFILIAIIILIVALFFAYLVSLIIL